MQAVEVAGDVAGIALGGGVLITAAKTGGKRAIVKTVAKMAAGMAVGHAAGKELEAAGVNQQTVRRRATGRCNRVAIVTPSQ